MQCLVALLVATASEPFCSADLSRIDSGFAAGSLQLSSADQPTPGLKRLDLSGLQKAEQLEVKCAVFCLARSLGLSAAP